MLVSRGRRAAWCQTCLLYLNEEWHAAVHGGALRIHLPVVAEGEGVAGCTSCVDVPPHAGTLVLFRADKTLHEVRPAFRPRFAVSIWFDAVPEGASASPAG